MTFRWGRCACPRARERCSLATPSSLSRRQGTHAHARFSLKNAAFPSWCPYEVYFPRSLQLPRERISLPEVGLSLSNISEELLRIKNPTAGDNQLVIPDISRGRELTRILIRMVGQKPDLSEFLVFVRIAGT
jgi:hypothetical protein